MDIVTSNYMPGDPRLIDQIVYELKSQGIFDQFRKECIADVDTKPAYQNLSQRVEGSVMNFLKKQKFSEEINKNQLREQLRKNISESGFLETGVERIVDQVVNPKINTVFLPKVEAVVYQYLGIEKPSKDSKQDISVNVDLLPNDLEAISPESVNEKKDESIETNENSLNSSNTKTEDESPPFELLEENTKFSVHEEISEDSHLSGISGLASHDSSHNTEMKDANPVDIAQDISQNSLNSGGNLSIVTSDEDTKMEICEDSNLSGKNESKNINCVSNDNDELGEIKKDEENSNVCLETDVKDSILEKSEEKTEETKCFNEIKTNDKKEVEDKKYEDKKNNDNKNDCKRSHDKHKSSRSEKDRKDDKDDKDKKSRSKSESKSKDHKDYKSSSKHSSSSKDRDKDRRENRNGKDKEEIAEKDKLLKKEDKDRDRSKETSSKSKEKSEKDKDKSSKDKEKLEKERSNKDKSDRDKEKLDKDKTRTEKEKSKSDRDKNRSDKDKSEKDKSSSSKHSKEKSSSSSKKEKDKSVDKTSRDKSSSSKDRASSGSKHKESANKDKDSSKNSKDKDKSKSSSSSSKDKGKERKDGGDSKSRSSDKSKKSDKSSHNEKSSSSKKDKDKKTVDDHYSLKDKKCERRSTDRDSNDGSSKVSRNGSFTESYSQSFKGSSKESSEVFTSGSGDSSNSDRLEENQTESGKDLTVTDIVEAPQTIKYIKPKFASNIHEAMKIMKIRRQLAKLERQNQLSLAHVHAAKDTEGDSNIQHDLKELSIVLEKSPQKVEQNNVNYEDIVKCDLETEELQVSPSKQHIAKEKLELPIKNISNSGAENESIRQNTLELHNSGITPMLKSQDLSQESFEALEARLAQEMSNVNYHMYGEEDDTYECSSVSTSPVKKRKAVDEIKPCFKKIVFNTSDVNVDDEEVELVVSKQAPIFSKNIENHCKETVVTKLMEVPSEKTNVVETITESTIIENGEELQIDEVHEGGTSIQETIINDMSDIKNSTINEHEVELAEQKLEEPVRCIKETTVQDNVYNHCDIETETLNHNVDSEKIKITNEFNEEFRGFGDVDRDNSKLIKFTQSITKMRMSVDQMLNNTNKALTKKHNDTSVIPKTEKSKIISPGKENEISLKHGFKAAVKEVKNMSSTLQDLLQKNGKKLFVKIDKLECELPSKALVNLQGMESREIVNSHIGEVKNVSLELRQAIQEKFKRIIKGNVELLQVQKKEFKQNGKLLKESSNVGDAGFMLKSDSKIREQKEHRESNVVTWEDDDSPCYYLNKSNFNNEARIKILNNMIEKLEKAIQKQSLQIHNNIPTVKKRGRKRKAESPDINTVSQCKPEPKKRHLSDAKSNINGESLCNNNVSPNQSFSLPLSPADSDKSEEHKKEEPVTVKTKRTGRVSLGSSNNKRYSSEDLYKPRPNLNFTSARRRGCQPEENKL